MKIVVGGSYQGKLKYVMTTYGVQKEQVLDGADMPFNANDVSNYRVLNHTHLLVKRLLDAHQDVAVYFEKLVLQNAELIFISDEVGNGVVPVDKADRVYREQVGRLLCRLVYEADSLERVICGIGQRLK